MDQLPDLEVMNFSAFSANNKQLFIRKNQIKGIIVVGIRFRGCITQIMNIVHGNLSTVNGDEKNSIFRALLLSTTYCYVQ